jgi:sorting nexin-7/30/sorting nexin-8
LPVNRPVLNNSSSSNDFKLPNEPFEEYEEIIKTEKLQNNELTEKNDLYVTVSNPVKVKDGFFSSCYYNYTVKTNPVGYSVVRRVSDFTFLYKALPIINCAVLNPILPQSEFGLKDDSPKKILFLQKYLNSLVENKFFRTLPIVLDFLSLSQKEWNKLRLEKYSNLKPPSLSKMPTLEGELHININKSEDNKGLKIKDEIKQKIEAYDAFNNAMDELISTIDKLSLCYKNLSKSLLDLSKSHKDNQILNEFFNRIFTLSRAWERDYLEEKNLLKDEFQYFFKYINMENISFAKKYEEFKFSRDEYKSKYDKVKKMQNKTKKDLNLIEYLRRNYGLELYMVNNEYQKLQERQANRCILQFMKYNDKKDIIFQNFNKCIKLFNMNEESNNSKEQIEIGNDWVVQYHEWNNEENNKK